MPKIYPKIRILEPSLESWTPRHPVNRQVAVMVSGGVDSSVTALLLKNDGWDVLGITMKIPVLCDRPGGCCGADAALVCHELEIPHYYLDVTGDFHRLVIDRFRQAYATGRTPNPCVDCNTLLKFSLVWDFVKSQFGIPNLATGHYARLVKTPTGAKLAMAADMAKDQSYFLCEIPADRMERLILPMGDMTKSKARKMAHGAGLSVADKAESMELCFAAEGDYRQALNDPMYNRAGDLLDMKGGKLGSHNGTSNYTIGQRRGLGYAGGKPLYVARIDAQANTVTLGTREDVSSCDVAAERINILAPEQMVKGKRLSGKIRSYGSPQPCELIMGNTDRIEVRFDRPQFAPCRGQRLVLYDENDFIVAGGTIV